MMISRRQTWIQHQRSTRSKSITRSRTLSSSLSMNRSSIIQWKPSPPPPAPIVSSNPAALPFLHSRKKLPSVCLDSIELKERTEQILESQVGALFEFNRNKRHVDRDDAQEAWQIATPTIQRVEYLLRGHSAQIPGTLWEKWSSGGGGTNTIPAADDLLRPIEIMDALIERLVEEGSYYMEVRKVHLSQLAWEESIRKEEDPVANDWRKFARDNTIVDDDEEDDDWKEFKKNVADKEKKGTDDNNLEEEEGQDDLMMDYALPGPTVDMYDIFFDTLAVTADKMGDPRQFSARKASNLLTSRNVYDTFHKLYDRHTMDGGDDLNNNTYTMPTQISYNAAIRTVANLHYDGKSEVYRDLALAVALAMHDAITHSPLPNNSSTYAYILQVVSKYLPACELKGNVAHAFWKMAKTEGVYNDQVQKAYFQAHQPSNSARHDEWIDKNLKGFDWRTGVPQRWRRRVQKYRMIPKQTTY
jgi:hypothetical protein